jgi:hypothetical protein
MEYWITEGVLVLLRRIGINTPTAGEARQKRKDSGLKRAVL